MRSRAELSIQITGALRARRAVHVDVGGVQIALILKQLQRLRLFQYGGRRLLVRRGWRAY